MRPLTGEPLPLDLLNTTWISGGQPQDLLADVAGTREWLDEHGFDTPGDAQSLRRAREALRETREALRALVQDRTAIGGVNAVLERGAQRPRLTPDGVTRELDVAAPWCVPWLCAVELVALLEERGERVKGCANPDCILWFLDTTRPGTRRWCSMAACGNRDKAIRHGRMRGSGHR